MPPADASITITRNVLIPMRDGVRLAGRDMSVLGGMGARPSGPARSAAGQPGMTKPPERAHRDFVRLVCGRLLGEKHTAAPAGR